MKARLLPVVALVTGLEAIAPAHAATGDRSDQWIYRANESLPGTRVAVFLSWSYSSVLFRASCSKGTLFIQYFGDSEVKLNRGQSMALHVSGRTYKMAARYDDKTWSQPVLEGRILLSQEIRVAIGRATEVDIEAPNAMGEPWYTGSAPPLKQIVRECRQ